VSFFYNVDQSIDACYETMHITFVAF